MASILIVCYDTTTGRYLVQKAGSAQITNESITSAHLASGAVIGDRIAFGAIVSAKIASGIVGTVHLRDLNVTSTKLTAALIASIEAGVADEGVTSAKIASGAVGTVHMYPGAVTSSILASGAVGIPHIYHGAIISAKIASGIIAGVHIKDGSILSGEIGSGIIGDALLRNWGVISGKIASGIITEQQLVSGISIDISELSQEPSYRAAEIISAYQGIQFATSAYFGLAKISDIDTMPAIGIAIANIVSGAIGTFQYQGRITNPAWDFSGYAGNLLFLGSGQDISEVTRIAPSASGECVQRVGKVIAPDAIFLKPELTFVQIAE